MNNFPCMNCKNEVSQETAKCFAGVFVCSDCYEKAERTYGRCENELKRLLLMLREAIRIALVEAKLQYAQGTSLDEIPKEELLKMIVQLSEKKDGRTPLQSQVSRSPSR